MWNFSTSINISLKTQDEKASQGNILEFFLQGTIKTTFWMENLTDRWTQSRPFYPKSRLFFRFSKKDRGELLHLHPSFASVSVTELASISLNIHKISLKCLNKLFYTRALNMLDHLAYPTNFWSCRGFWIWHGCIYKGSDTPNYGFLTRVRT